MTVKDAADKLEISASLVYELCRMGIISHTRYGRPGSRGCIRISEEALAAYKSARGKEMDCVREPGPLLFIR